MGKGTRKVGGIKRIIGRTSNLTGRDTSKGLGRCENRRSGWSRSRRVVANRSVDSRIVTGKELLVAINKGETLIGESVTECTGEGGKGLGEFEL